MAEKTEEPTPKRREEARRRGEVALSRDAAGVAALLAAYALLAGALDKLRHTFTYMLRHGLSRASHGDPLGVAAGAGWLAQEALAVGLPVLGGALAAATLAVALQTRFLWSPEAALPKLSRVAPWDNLARLGKLRTYLEPLLHLLRGLLVLAAGASGVWVWWRQGARVGSPEGLWSRAGALLGVVGSRVCAALLVLAAVDLWYRWRQHEEGLKMSHQELKQEHKESEGDGQLKHARERLHRELLEEQSVAEVQRASFVVTNPTHYAVALRYEEGETEAPELVAKGEGDLARRILEEAHRHGIPVLRDQALARSLHELALGEEVPEALYEAVAAIVNHLSEGRDPDDY
ncbi:MAG: EscU/YscU/HrcU family type III secretion system export apparatus switch protein [Deltaproteobacteria bacterium]|nr:EscU/YscU/HrcU family type III secretion system export apparatus switch protein [Deltaproteobacteria bacterium]